MGEQFEVVAASSGYNPSTKEQLGSERVQNPHDPEATYAAKGKGEQSKEHVGYKVQVAETVTEAVLAAGRTDGQFHQWHRDARGARERRGGGGQNGGGTAGDGYGQTAGQYVDAAYISTQTLGRRRRRAGS